MTRWCVITEVMCGAPVWLLWLTLVSFSLSSHMYNSLLLLSNCWHYRDVIMGTIASPITSLTIVYSIIYSGTDQRKTSKLRVTGLCEGNSPVTGEFPAQKASNAQNDSIWWRHHLCHALIWLILMETTSPTFRYTLSQIPASKQLVFEWKCH